MTISYFIVNMLESLLAFYASGKLLDSKIKYNSYKIYLVLLIMTLYTSFMGQVTQNFIRTVILLQLYIICNFYLHYKNNKKFEEVTCISIIIWILLFISELICAIILFIFLAPIVNKINVFSNELIGLSIIFIGYLLINNKTIIKYSKKAIEFAVNFKNKNIILFSIYISLLLSTSLFVIYFNVSRGFKLALFVIILIEYGIVMSYILLERKRKNEIKKQLTIMLDITSNYEKLLEDFRINNHENKNQLIVIKGLIDPKNKNALNYVKNMIKTNFKDDDNIMLKVSKIPIGGLRGLIYYKLLKMQSLNIEFVLSVGKGINNHIFDKIKIESLQNYYKIIGVILDNAIDAVSSLEEKIISIEIYLEADLFVIRLSNQFISNIDFENLGKKKYSTKGNNHGYGLQLVERLVAADKNLMNEKEIIGQVFVQKAGIKIKK